MEVVITRDCRDLMDEKRACIILIARASGIADQRAIHQWVGL
jgi:hypothetical protein